MKIGMNLLLWTDRPNPSEHRGLLHSIAQWGFDGAEFPVDGMTLAEAQVFSLALADAGLSGTAIAALDAAVCDPASREPQRRAAALDALKSAIDNTAALGAHVLCGPLFQGLGRFSGAAPLPDERQYAAETLRAAGEYALERGVTLALEPINRFEMYIANTLADGARIVEAIGLPNVGLLADTHHGNIEERDVPAAWRQAAPLIKHVHISENDRGVPGSGHAVPPQLFRVLADIGYDGWLTIEAFGTQVPGLISRLHLWRDYSEHPDDAARLGVQYIKRQLAAGKE